MQLFALDKHNLCILEDLTVVSGCYMNYYGSRVANGWVFTLNWMQYSKNSIHMYEYFKYSVDHTLAAEHVSFGMIVYTDQWNELTED